MNKIHVLVIEVVAVLVVLMFAPRRRGRPPGPTVSPLTLYGTGLASAVADRLERGDVLSYRHRDYCGVGLRFVTPQYIYGEVFDGGVLTPGDLRATGTNPATIEHLVFDTRAEFISWLAAQSDESLAGNHLSSEWMRGNQRITRARLESFARGERVPHV